MVTLPREHAARIGSAVLRFFQAWACTVFRIDLRSLAAFRMAMALLILVDLSCRLGDVSVFLSDEGVLPRIARIEMQLPDDPEGYDHAWSLHMLSGETWAQVTLILLSMWFAAWMLVGYRTRLAVFATWLMMLSLSVRNPLVLDAGDSVQRTMLFWSMFVPLGAAWSMDARTSPRDRNDAQAVTSVATAAILLQLLVVYFGAAMFKMNPIWTREFSGVYYALHCDPFATTLGRTLRDHYGMTQVLTAATISLELCGPILLLVPWGNRWLRIALIAAFWLFHLGLAVTMTLGLFPWTCMACWLLFVPGTIWDRLGRTGWYPLLASAAARTFDSAGTGTRAERPRLAPSSVDAGLTWMFLIYAVFFNLRDALPESWADRVFPRRWNGLARVVGLEKRWGMFAPVPHREDGWPVLRGTLRDGSEVNLWEPGRELPWDKPASVSGLYHNQRWRRYLESLMMESCALNRPNFADWLQTRWNERFAQGNTAKEVAKVEILRRLETTPPPGEPFPVPETAVLWTKQYGHTVQAPDAGESMIEVTH